VIFQVLLQLSISRQSQAAVKNSPEWAALSVEQNKWADLLGLIVRLHTIHRGANIEEARIQAKIRFEFKIRTFKQLAGVDSGTHLERFDDLVAEGRSLDATLDQRELAYLLVNSMRLPASRLKRNLLMDIGKPTPNSYEIAKAFVLDAEAMARSVSDFGGQVHAGYAAVTEQEDASGDEGESPRDGGIGKGQVVLATADASKLGKRQYTAQEKREWKSLPDSERKKVTLLEDLAGKIRSGDKIEFDLRSIASSLSASTSPTFGEYRWCRSIQMQGAARWPQGALHERLPDEGQDKRGSSRSAQSSSETA
jgi:hypothetical protein